VKGVRKRVIHVKTGVKGTEETRGVIKVEAIHEAKTGRSDLEVLCVGEEGRHLGGHSELAGKRERIREIRLGASLGANQLRGERKLQPWPIPEAVYEKSLSEDQGIRRGLNLTFKI